MKTRSAIALAAVLMLALALLPTPASAQEQPAQSKATGPQAWTFYRLDFTVREMDNGKTLNSRSYTMNMRSGSGSFGQIRVGNRIPYNGEKGPQYMDVGFNVDTRFEENGASQSIEINTELSTLPMDYAGGAMPVLRTSRVRSIIPMTLNKPILLSSLDEIASTHRMQIEVTISQQK